MKPTSHAAARPTEKAEDASRVLGLRLVKVSGGDRAFADALRDMIWREYCDAGCPLGATEYGMLNWWEQR